MYFAFLRGPLSENAFRMTKGLFFFFFKEILGKMSIFRSIQSGCEIIFLFIHPRATNQEAVDLTEK